MPLSIAPRAVAIPAGSVAMHDARTGRRWSVEVAPFEIGATPVTQIEYAAVTGEWPAARRGDLLPVEGVSWWDAIEYCNALSIQAGFQPAYERYGDTAVWLVASDGYRLPTEAEWERACRADSTGPRYGAIDAVAWFRDNSDERLHPVGGKEPNGWGLYDMLGSVWEWCWDLADPDRYGTYRSLRGGGWFDEHWSVRASVRRNSYPGLRIDDVGFRVVRSLVAPDSVRLGP
ncbi:formylglycine-generating enzyme family protein [Plantibacter sp. Mn2098]|uniref:formylglycine-generating enzyme family protein n=1 Tax=Plantibacter sp. Mn2098 TaxID=3395266 RepID=UPI003BE71C93